MLCGDGLGSFSRDLKTPNPATTSPLLCKPHTTAPNLGGRQLKGGMGSCLQASGHQVEKTPRPNMPEGRTCSVVAMRSADFRLVVCGYVAGAVLVSKASMTVFRVGADGTATKPVKTFCIFCIWLSKLSVYCVTSVHCEGYLGTGPCVVDGEANNYSPKGQTAKTLDRQLHI